MLRPALMFACSVVVPNLPSAITRTDRAASLWPFGTNVLTTRIPTMGLTLTDYGDNIPGTLMI